MARAWMAVGCEYPAASTPRSTSGDKPSDLNGMSGRIPLSMAVSQVPNQNCHERPRRLLKW